MKDGILEGLPAGLIRSQLGRAAGNEIESGKVLSPESSAALAANAFGLFLENPSSLPPLPVVDGLDWRPASVALEVECRFPWAGGRHPWLDVVIALPDALAGVESKRYEPFRDGKGAQFSDAYWRDVWGDNMSGYAQVRDALHSGALQTERLDAAQLVKHAFGLRTQAQPAEGVAAKRPVLVYLYAEPAAWPDGRAVASAHHAVIICVR